MFMEQFLNKDVTLLLKIIVLDLKTHILKEILSFSFIQSDFFPLIEAAFIHFLFQLFKNF
jgi:hypothetical protein